MTTICIIIRVYDRVEDLSHCVRIIKSTWTSFKYYIIVVFNGSSNGFEVDHLTIGLIDELVIIKENSGHLTGNSQLLLAGIQFIPGDCDYTVFLEADTWLYKDNLIVKYLAKMTNTGSVWASAQWYQYTLSLATDFAIVQTSLLKKHSAILDFVDFPEYFVAYYLQHHGYKFTYIEENMPVNLPSYINYYPFSFKNRFVVFPRSKMVTHHVEYLKKGMIEKQMYFNLLANFQYFDIEPIQSPKIELLKIRISILLSHFIPRKSYFIRSKNIRFIKPPF